MKVKYYSELLFKDLRKEDLDDILSFCRKSNFKLNLGEDYLHVTTNKAIYFIGIVKVNNEHYYYINQLSKYNNLSLKSLLSRIKIINK